MPKSRNYNQTILQELRSGSFLHDLNSVPFSVSHVFDDPDDVYWGWEKLYNHVLDDHAPVITTKKRRLIGSKFTTTDIRKAMRVCDRLKKKFHESRNPWTEKIIK